MVSQNSFRAEYKSSGGPSVFQKPVKFQVLLRSYYLLSSNRSVLHVVSQSCKDERFEVLKPFGGNTPSLKELRVIKVLKTPFVDLCLTLFSKEALRDVNVQ